MFGPLLEVEMSDVQMSFRVAGARDSAPCQKWANREGFVTVSTTTTTLHYTPLQLQLHYITLHCTNYITLHSTPLTTATATATSTLHCITLRYTNYIALVYTTPPYTTPHYANYNYNYTTPITLHYATPHHANYNYSYNYATLHTLR